MCNSLLTKMGKDKTAMYLLMVVVPLPTKMGKDSIAICVLMAV